ncbi:hypothetical protein ACFWWM_38035, partial [Streptomyces sp. NPDC058682]
MARRREAPAHVLADRVDRHRLANLVWTGWQTSAIAAAVGVGADGAFAWAESWGPQPPDRVWRPRHPDRVLHDWTQERRELCARLPDTTYAERSALIDAERAAQENGLVAALADRGAMTREESSARLERGGTVYRPLLDVGQATICRALHTARRALPEGPELTAVRHTIDELMYRHVRPAGAEGIAGAERIAGAQLDTEILAGRVLEKRGRLRGGDGLGGGPGAGPPGGGGG